MRIIFGSMFCSVVLITCFGTPSFAENQVFTNEDVRQLSEKSEDFKKSHSVMIQQRERLKAILNGFLVGDTQTINEKSDELLKSMKEVIENHPPSGEKESAAWQSMADIVNETNLMKEEASKNDYDKAYVHFSRIAGSCIQCHQVVREWGKLPEPLPHPEEKNASSDATNQKEAISKKSTKKNNPNEPLVSQ